MREKSTVQPKTKVKFDEKSFARIKRTIRNMSQASRERQSKPDFATPLPDEVGLQLTNRCNLRCKHCYQWSEEGHHNNLDSTLQKTDLDFGIIEKIFSETRDVKSNLYVWGGEPLCYEHWNKFCDLLAKDPRWTVLCTNATGIESNLASIVKISGSLAALVSLDGFEMENDFLRGKGAFKKALGGIDALLDCKAKGDYKGEVSVNCVITDGMAGKLYDFLEYFEAKGVNTVYFCFPWYIPEDTCLKMDAFFEKKFNWLPGYDKDRKNSWHSYSYNLHHEMVDELKKNLQKINDKAWNIRVRYQPALEMEEVENFITGAAKPGQQRKSCLAASNRMNVGADGTVTVCKMFPEFTIGDLNKRGVHDLWNSEEFKKARLIISQGLMPICSKCILLYLHGR
jgi:radical SAM protein with 4Fe4S-binding SPASM domain